MQKATVLLLTAVTCAMLVSCGGESSESKLPAERISPSDVLVYESRLAVQCGTRGLTTQESAQKLVNGGIDVLESNCGVVTGVVQAAVCGIGTPELLIHKIRKVNLADAKQLGFDSVSILRDPARGTDYAKVDCDTGALLP